MYTAGSNDNGQLGTKITRTPSMQAGGGAAAVPPDCSWKPLRVNALDLYKVQHASAGQSHVLAVTEQVRREGKGGVEGYLEEQDAACICGARAMCLRPLSR